MLTQTFYPAPSQTYDPTNWFVAQTKPSKISLAQRHLEDQEFRTFVPLTSEKVVHPKNHTTQVIKKPLFPNYIFVHLPPYTPWSKINNTRGIKYLLTGASANTEGDDFAIPVPVPVKANVIQALLRTPVIHLDPGPHPGDRIRIITTIFEGETALITAITKNRLFIILDTFQTEISIHKSQYEPIH